MENLWILVSEIFTAVFTFILTQDENRDLDLCRDIDGNGGVGAEICSHLEFKRRNSYTKHEDNKN